VADRADRARQALAAAKADALAKGSRRAVPPGPGGQPPATPRTTDKDTERFPAPRQPAPAARSRGRLRRDDPQPLAAAIKGLMDDRNWQLAAATGSVFGRWAQIVGPELAAHTTPDGLADGELTVTADSTAWATQLRLLAGQLMHRLNAELGEEAVRRVRVRGPASAPRQPGGWRVRGGRGPRDTYG
jgi:predicted nucleic acid-binding Zn ribbon protein